MTMKIKVQHLMDATMVIRQIITEKRPLPQKGNYRLARMFDKLAREFDILNAKRDEMIKAYDYHPMVPNPAYHPAEEGMRDRDTGVVQFVPKEIPSAEWSVPPEHIAEFTKQWAELGAEEIEVDVEPIPLEQLCFADPDVQATIDASEFIALGSLVKE